jgi:hypothetical protein
VFRQTWGGNAAAGGVSRAVLPLLPAAYHDPKVHALLLLPIVVRRSGPLRRPALLDIAGGGGGRLASQGALAPRDVPPQAARVLDFERLLQDEARQVQGPEQRVRLGAGAAVVLRQDCK